MKRKIYNIEQKDNIYTIQYAKNLIDDILGRERKEDIVKELKGRVYAHREDITVKILKDGSILSPIDYRVTAIENLKRKF